MKPCPYRKEHEWDDKGMCLHCYATTEDEPVAPGLFAWGPMANFLCSVAGCADKAVIVVSRPGRYSTRCQAHKEL